MAYYWITKTFTELLPGQLYSILQLREHVFHIEQRCIYNDLDEKDLVSSHLLCIESTTEKLIAYCRILPAHVSFNEVSIGRVVTAPQVRHMGMGKQLMKVAMQKVVEYYGHTPIRIGAQLYLRSFYENFQFVQVSEVYDEDAIDHIEMLFTPVQT